MARIRSLRPDFFTREDLAEVSETACLLAAGLDPYADDEGYFYARPELIKAALFPIRKTERTVTEALEELAGIGWVRLYRGRDGRTYGFLPGFSERQRVEKKTSSKIKPLIVEDEDGPAAATCGETASAPRALPDSSPNGRKAGGEASALEGKGREGKGEEGKGTEGVAAGAAGAPHGDELGLEGPGASPSRPKDLLAVWNANRGALREARGMGRDRERVAAARLREEPKLGVYAEAVRHMSNLPHIVAKAWFDLDQLLKPGMLVRIQEGKYDRPFDEPTPRVRASLAGAHEPAVAPLPKPVRLEGLGPRDAEPWASIRKALRGRVDERDFESWFDGDAFRQAVGANGTLRIVAVKAALFAEYVRENYREVLQKAAESAVPGHPIRIEVLTPEEWNAAREIPTGSEVPT